MKICKSMLCIVVLLNMLLITTCAINTSANSAVVIDSDTSRIYYSKNHDKRLPMASTTKIMTAIIAIEEGNIDRDVIIKKEYTLVEGSSMYLKTSETVSMRDLIYGLLLMSGNDAALAIAGECGGLEVFVKKMNDKAESLGLTDTHFDNPNGLDGETHYTTAYELAKITQYALSNPVFREIVSTNIYKSNDRVMRNHNKLLRIYEHAIGVKTGFTKKSGRCLVSAAEKNGRTLITVTLNASDDWNDHINLYENLYGQFGKVELHKKGDVAMNSKIYSGNLESVDVVFENGVDIYLSDKEKARLIKRVYGKKFLYAPVKQGDIYGRIEYILDNEVMASDRLIIAGDVEENIVERGIVERILDFIYSLV